MKKYILITIIALLTLSCSDKGAEETSANAATATEQVDASQVKTDDAKMFSQPTKEKTFREKFYESGKQKKVSNFPLFFAYLLILANIIVTVFAIIYVIDVRGKLRDNERCFNNRMETRKGDIDSLNADIDKLRQEIGRLKQQKSTSYQRSYGQATPIMPNLGATSTPQNVGQRQENQRGGKNNKTQTTRQKNEYTQVIYLEANSDDCFFQFYDQKRDTSKFVAHVVLGGVAATFEVIDVERIRSLNTSRSVKQAGSVAIKDAQGIKEQKPGKIHKTKESNGAEYWVIDEPVTVEFKK